MKRYVAFGVAAPIAAWLGLIVVGKKPGDVAGTAVWMQRGFLLPFTPGLLIETVAAGVLVAYLTKKAVS
jgi:hypothetical protein